MSRHLRWRGAVLDEFGIGRTAFLLVCIPSVLGILTVLPDSISIPTGLALWISASVVSTGFLGLIFLASADLRARLSISIRLMPIVVLVTMLLAGGARGLGVVLVFRLAGEPDSSTVAGRIFGSSVIFTVWLVLIGGFLSALAGYRNARQELLDEIVMRELQMRLVDESRAAGKFVDAAARLNETTSMVREILESADVGNAEEYARLSLLLHQAIDERIRPLVHEMWFEPSPEFDAPDSTRGFLRKAYLTRVPLPWALSLYAFIETSGAVLALGWRLGIQAALVEWCAFALVILGERLLRPVPGILSRSVTTVLLLVLPLLGAWLLVGSRLEAEISFFALLAFVVTAPILMLTCCAARAVLDDRGPSLKELQLRLGRDDWSEQLEMLERRAAENSVASVIHNTVQARLLAAALQLETAAMTNDEERAAGALEDARSALDSASRPTSVAAVSPELRLRSIAEAWRGIIAVEIAVDSNLAVTTEVTLALDAIEECVANSARHASATAVEVSLCQLPEALEVIVSDNGSVFTEDSRVGVGSEWMIRISSGRMTRTRLTSGWNQVRLLLGGDFTESHA